MDDFNSLALTDKEEVLLKQGHYLLSTDFYGATVKLYALNSFFVEVYHHPVLQKIMRISIAREEELKKHLSRIKVRI